MNRLSPFELYNVYSIDFKMNTVTYTMPGHPLHRNISII